MIWCCIAWSLLPLLRLLPITTPTKETLLPIVKVRVQYHNDDNDHTMITLIITILTVAISVLAIPPKYGHDRSRSIRLQSVISERTVNSSVSRTVYWCIRIAAVCLNDEWMDDYIKWMNSRTANGFSLILLIYALFNDAASNSDILASNNKITN